MDEVGGSIPPSPLIFLLPLTCSSPANLLQVTRRPRGDVQMSTDARFLRLPRKRNQKIDECLVRFRRVNPFLPPDYLLTAVTSRPRKNARDVVRDPRPTRSYNDSRTTPSTMSSDATHTAMTDTTGNAATDTTPAGLADTQQALPSLLNDIFVTHILRSE